MTDAGDTPDAPLSIWRGERVYLRATEPEDWAAYFANNDDSEGRGLRGSSPSRARRRRNGGGRKRTH